MKRSSPTPFDAMVEDWDDEVPVSGRGRPWSAPVAHGGGGSVAEPAVEAQWRAVPVRGSPRRQQQQQQQQQLCRGDVDDYDRDTMSAAAAARATVRRMPTRKKTTVDRGSRSDRPCYYPCKK